VKMRLAQSLLAMVLVVASVLPLSSPPGVAHAATTGIDVALVLDDSGSTVGAENSVPTDPTGRRCLAGQVLVNLLDPTDSFTLIRFATDAQTDVPLSELSPAVRSRSLTALDTCPGKGSTNYVAALQQAQDQFARSDPARPKYVIFATDGEPTVGGGATEILNLARDFGAHGWHIYPVAFDVAVNASLLEQIASVSGGRFLQAKTSADVPAVFQQIFAGLKDLVYLPSQQICGTSPQTIHIGQADYAMFTILYPPRTSIRVLSPRGAALERTNSYQGKPGDYSNQVVVATKPAGEWTFQLMGATANQCAPLGGEVHYPSQMSIESPAPVGFTGQPIDLRANYQPMNDQGQYAFDPQIQLRATLQPEGDTNPKDTQSVNLQPVNQRYEATFAPISQPGVVAVDLFGSANGEPRYASPSPLRVELVAPPAVTVVTPGNPIKAKFGEGVPVKVQVQPVPNVTVSGVTLDMLDSKGTLVESLPLTSGDGGAWTGSLPLWQSGSFQLQPRLNAKIHGPQLGKDSDSQYIGPSQTIQADVSSPGITWQVPTSVGLIPNQPLPLKACYPASAIPSTVPVAQAIFGGPNLPSQTIALGAMDSLGCYSGAAHPDVRGGPATYTLHLNLLNDQKRMVWSGAEQSVAVASAKIQLKLDYPTGTIQPGAQLKVRMQTVDGAPVSLQNARGTITIQPPSGAAQVVPLIGDGTILNAPIQITVSGDYNLQVQVQGDLVGEPTAATLNVDGVHWTVPPSVTIAPVFSGQAQYWSLGTVGQNGPAPDQQIVVSTNLDTPVTLTAMSSSPNLQVTLDPSVIPAAADHVKVTVHTRLVSPGNPPLLGGSQLADLTFTARAGNQDVPVQPNQSVRGLIQFWRNGLLDSATRSGLPIVAGFAFILGLVVLVLKSRRRSLPDAGVGQLVAVKGKGATVILSQNRRGWWKELTAPQQLILGGPRAETSLVAPGAARILATRQGNKTVWYLERLTDPPFTVIRDEEQHEPAIGEKFLLVHDDQLDFGLGATYRYVNLAARADDFWRKPNPTTTEVTSR